MIRSKLKNLREQKGWTYEYVGNLAGISKEAYWMIENGKRGLSYERAVKIASVFNLTPDDIFLHSELTSSEQKVPDK
ncbi:hypothetical protein IWT25_00710 [Secundilactobacillus pentosiphilus]|uniref:HTH cro/C1-type domain-containing protein n=1 Tax=Secundilactobacillus pentosiphilus TaxID=1714682 RepID=A0A1Z5IUP8_9LACO|nr:helix-turn-helix transcriptional regulator [Secundilactobacillus pentosiphilus]GAX05406.1 hypothetical protein IWT25_00710 [Secundilactobacillus pentosiphilus]